jgi:arylsulfatase A-like enzyme
VTGEVPLLDLTGEPPRDLIVLSIDTLRRDFVGRYAGTTDTPWMDGFLAEAVVLDDHASCANWTVASFVCLFTGSSSLDLGFEPESGDPAVPGMPERLNTWPEAFRSRGHDTGLVSANPYVHVKPRWPLGAGFADHWMEANARGEVLVDEALDMLDRLSSPRLLQVHFMDTHEPYEAPAELVDPAPEISYDLDDPEDIRQLEQDWTSLSDQDKADVQGAFSEAYRGEVRYLDQQLAALWAGLDAAGALDDTLVLLVSDHGQQHMERARWAHGNHLHQEETAALAAFWAPGITPAVYTGLTTHEDLAATLNTLYGLGLEPRSGVPIGEADEDRPRLQQYYRTHGEDVAPLARQSLETATWRLSYAWNGVQRLHHRIDDPKELTDVLETGEPPELAELWELLQPRVDRLHQELLAHREPAVPGS